MSYNLATAAYLGSAILFILSLGGLSHPETARRGNVFGMVGMLIAVLATVFGPRVDLAIGLPWILAALALGGSIGLYAARKVQMTQMPELVALMHSLVGLAACLVGFASYIDTSTVIEGAEKYQVEYNRTRERIDGTFHGTDQAIAMAVMYTANHIDVRAIFALTESGSTTLWMSRVRSDIPIYAFTRHESTRRRVTLYRGVYPVAFDVTHTDPEILYPSITAQAVELGLCKAGDSIIVTKGELSGVSGGTNSMKILRVPG